MITISVIAALLTVYFIWDDNGGKTKKQHLREIVQDDLNATKPKSIEEHLTKYYGARKPSPRRLAFFEKNYSAYLERGAEKLSAKNAEEAKRTRKTKAMLEEAEVLRSVSRKTIRELQ